MSTIQTTVGSPAQSAGPNTNPPLRSGPLADLIVSELHGKYYEYARTNSLYSTGVGPAFTMAATHAVATLGATCTPICGVWNPLTSTVKLILLKAKCVIALAPASAGVTGNFVWATSTGQSAISTGLNPLNRGTLANAGSQAKGFANTALTGLVGNLVVQHAAAMGGLVAAQGATATPIISGDAVEEFDGGWIIPPGGVVALLSSSTNTTVSLASMLMWGEVPL